MAKAQPTALLGLIKGSIGSTTFQTGNGLNVLKNKGYKKGSTTSLKSNAISKISGITARWRSLTEDNRKDWNSAIGDWAFTDSFGNTYYGPGFRMFTAYNRNLFTLTGSFSDTPTSPVTIEDVTPFDVDTLLSSNIVLKSALSPISDQYWIVYASPMYSPGRNDNNPTLKFITAHNQIGSDSLNIFDDYIAIYPAPITGQKIIFKVFQSSPDFPRYYFPYTFSGLVG